MRKNSTFVRACAQLVAVALFGLSTLTQAAPVTMNFDSSGDGDDTFQNTAGGITATFSNPEGGEFENFFAVGIGSGLFPLSFDVSFDQDIELLSYTTRPAFGTISFNITGPGVSSIGNFETTGSDFVGQPLALQANSTYAFTGVLGTTFGSIEITSWTFDDQPATGGTAPTPASSPLLLTGLVLGTWLRRRRGF